MGISYNPLWEMLKEKGISKMEFAKNVEISNATLAKLGKNEPVTLTIIDKICTQYNCKIEDVVQHIPTMHLDVSSKIPLDVSSKGILDDTSKIPLDIGTIISTNYPFHKEDSRHQCYFVIIEKEKHSQLSFFPEDNNNYRYTVALLRRFAREERMGISFPEIIIDNRLYSGIIDLQAIRFLPSNANFTIVGKMPSEVIDKLNSFNNFIKKLNDTNTK